MECLILLLLTMIGCLTYRLFALLLCLNFCFNSLDFCISIVLFTRLDKYRDIFCFMYNIIKIISTVAAMSEGLSDSVAFFLLCDMIGLAGGGRRGRQ